jgi:hypothetical protein
MSAGSFVIRYEFTHATDATEPPKSAVFTIELDPRTLLNLAPLPSTVPHWAKLSFHKCPNCPLSEDTSPGCPVAMQLSSVVDGYANIFSYQRVSARVTVPERTYEQTDIAVQGALSSLLGVYMVTCGCPVLAKLRPMVRFHLPFATDLETITRATSMYLLGQYLVAQDGGTPDWALQNMAEDYRAAGIVNRAFAARLRAAAPKDANVNALIRLDSVARSLPELIESQMDELKFLFGK